MLANRWTQEYLGFQKLDACLHFNLYHSLGPYHPYGLNPITWCFVCSLYQKNKHHAVTYKVHPSKSFRAKLPHHSSLQSTLSVLGQGADSNKKFGKYKVCGFLIYTPTPEATCVLSAATCAHIVPMPFQRVPILTYNQWPSIRAETRLHFAMVVYISNPICVRFQWSCSQSLSHKESTPDTMRLYEESMSSPTRMHLIHLSMLLSICLHLFPPINARRVLASTNKCTRPIASTTRVYLHGIPTTPLPLTCASTHI